MAGDEAIGSEGVEGLDVAAGVEFGHGVRAVVEVVGPRPGVGLLPGPQTVPGVAAGAQAECVIMACASEPVATLHLRKHYSGK